MERYKFIPIIKHIDKQSHLSDREQEDLATEILIMVYNRLADKIHLRLRKGGE